LTIETINSGRLTLACADLDARPLFWTDSDHQRFGYEPAIAAAVAATLGLELRWRFLRWSEFIPALADEQVDAIWCGCAITPERELKFLFSRPYAIFNESVLVRREDNIHSPDHLRGRRVGAIADSTNMLLAKTWPDCRRVAFDGASDDVFADMVNALRRGEIDAVVDDEPAFGGLLNDPDLSLGFTIATGNRWGAAMRPVSSRLKVALDSALDSLIRADKVRQIWKDWLGYIEYPELEPGIEQATC